MSVLDEIKQLEAQKQKLLSKAKSDALKAAQRAIGELRALGFDYHLTEGSEKSTERAAVKKPKKIRRSGIREQVLQKIAASEGGLSRKELIAGMGVNDKSGMQSVSNALFALKKASLIAGDKGSYQVVP